jgi:putative oxidoreductase
MQLKPLLQFTFLPSGGDFAILVLRLWTGLSMLLLHGWGKLTTFSEASANFPDPLGIGSTASLILAVFAEVICSGLVAVGLFTRFAVLVLIINMSVAFFVVHQHVLRGTGNGELAFIYLAAFTTIFVAGPGRFSLDHKL